MKTRPYSPLKSGFFVPKRGINSVSSELETQRNIRYNMAFAPERREGIMMTRPFRLIVGGLLAAMCLLPNLAWGQTSAELQAIGKIVSASGAVTVEHKGALVVQASAPASGEAKAGDQVYRGDVVRTGANGILSLVFTDGTTFNISSNANMELNEFVYDPKGSSNSTLINLKKGTFTFIAGAIAHTGNMKVETPVGTMGIRGTAPHVEIAEDGSV
jgi:hypothetical protein